MRALLVLVVACAGNKPAPRPIEHQAASVPTPAIEPERDESSNRDDKRLRAWTALRDKMCECQDLTCAIAVSDEASKWADAQPKPDDAELPAHDPKLQFAVRRYAACLGQALATSTGSATTPPITP